MKGMLMTKVLIVAIGVSLLAGGAVAATYVEDNFDADNANWQNDTNRTSPVGATTKPGAGDLVVWVEEVSGSGTIDFCVTVTYEAA